MLENCRTPNTATVAFPYIYSWGIRIPNILGPLLTDIKPLSRWTSHSHGENSPSNELRMEVLALNDYVKEHRVEESHRELGCAWQCQCLGLWLLSSWAFLAPSSSFTVLFTFLSRTLKAVVSPIHLEFLRNDLEFCQTSGMHAFLSCHWHSFSTCVHELETYRLIQRQNKLPSSLLPKKSVIQAENSRKNDSKAHIRERKNHDALCLRSFVCHQIIVSQLW